MGWLPRTLHSPPPPNGSRLHTTVQEDLPNANITKQNTTQKYHRSHPILVISFVILAYSLCFFCHGSTCCPKYQCIIAGVKAQTLGYGFVSAQLR